MRATYVAAPWIAAFSYQYRAPRLSDNYHTRVKRRRIHYRDITDDTATSLTVPPITIKFQPLETDEITLDRNVAFRLELNIGTWLLFGAIYRTIFITCSSDTCCCLSSRATRRKWLSAGINFAKWWFDSEHRSRPITLNTGSVLTAIFFFLARRVFRVSASYIAYKKKRNSFQNQNTPLRTRARSNDNKTGDAPSIWIY